MSVLLVRGHRVGTAFAISEICAVTARHNVFERSCETVGERAIQVEMSALDFSGGAIAELIEAEVVAGE